MLVADWLSNILTGQLAPEPCILDHGVEDGGAAADHQRQASGAHHQAGHGGACLDGGAELGAGGLCGGKAEGGGIKLIVLLALGCNTEPSSLVLAAHSCLSSSIIPQQSRCSSLLSASPKFQRDPSHCPSTPLNSLLTLHLPAPCTHQCQAQRCTIFDVPHLSPSTSPQSSPRLSQPPSSLSLPAPFNHQCQAQCRHLLDIPLALPHHL